MLENQQSAPIAPPIVGARDFGTNNKTKEWEDSINSAMADAQNQLNMVKYNNDYNYWLWQQQTLYNTPSEQVKRLKEAGLNPNYNSIEGAGNASSPSPSQGRLNTNFLGAYQASISSRAQRLNEINAVVSGFNDLVKNVAQGFDIYRTYVNTPSSGENYRNALYLLMNSKSIASSLDTALKVARNPILLQGENPHTSDLSSLSNTPFGQAVLGKASSDAWSGSIAQERYNNLVKDGNLKDIVSDLKRFERDELQPKQKELLEQQVDSLFSRTQFIDTQNDMYRQLKVGGMLLPFALMLFKGLL